MTNLIVVNAATDQRGAHKENIFIALDSNGQTLGSLSIYPFFDADAEPEHPYNLYLALHTEREQGAGEPVQDALLEHALRRATEIKSEAGQAKTRVYVCFFKHQQDEIAYFVQRGFVHDEGMYILERRAPAALPPVQAPQAIAVQPWEMETDEERRQFIETHRKIFPRHPYTVARLRELASLPGWNNFVAWSGAEIAGSIMVFTKPDKDDLIGYIEDLFVQKQWRKRGIARYLLHTAITYLQNSGLQRIQLEMWSANKAAFQLYRLFGFSPIDETEIAVGRYV